MTGILDGEGLRDAVLLADGSAISLVVAGPPHGASSEQAADHTLRLARWGRTGDRRWARAIGPFLAYGPERGASVVPRLAVSEGRIYLALQAPREPALDGDPGRWSSVGPRASQDPSNRYQLHLGVFDARSGALLWTDAHPPVLSVHLEATKDAIHLVASREHCHSEWATFPLGAEAELARASARSSRRDLPLLDQARIDRRGALIALIDGRPMSWSRSKGRTMAGVGLGKVNLFAPFPSLHLELVGDRIALQTTGEHHDTFLLGAAGWKKTDWRGVGEPGSSHPIAWRPLAATPTGEVVRALTVRRQ
ncbi:MAG: hypothetical protein AAGA56_09945 [Myxococcota bacterium]